MSHAIVRFAAGTMLILLPWMAGDAQEAGSATAARAAARIDPLSAAGAASVVRTYYAAIEARSYRRAYTCWGQQGASSRKTYRQFVAGFANTAHVRATVGAPGPVEGAAGSRYVEIPVTVLARTRDGKRQRFTGTYVMRRAVVDGATAAQRRWHIDSARLRAVRA